MIKGAVHHEKQWNGDFPSFYNWLVKGVVVDDYEPMTNGL